MKVVVTEIQVGGGPLASTLEEAFTLYIFGLPSSAPDKINFTVKLLTGEVKHITLRQENDQVIAYGDLEGLPSFLEYSKETLGKVYPK